MRIILFIYSIFLSLHVQAFSSLNLESLPFNYFQAKGTHNSYHIRPRLVVDESFNYSHKSILAQLETYGIRQLELDININRKNELKVNHLPFIDFKSHCVLLKDCLTTIKEWSDRNKSHYPVVVWIEPKVNFIYRFHPKYKKFKIEHVYKAENLINSIFSKDDLFIPDQLRGDSLDLPSALKEKGWPSLKNLRGKVMFVLLNTKKLRDEYTKEALNLEGKTLFVQSTSPTAPSAAFFKEHNLEGFGNSQQLLKNNFILTMMSDRKAKSFENNKKQINECIDNGIHFLSGDNTTNDRLYPEVYFQEEAILNTKVIELNQ